MSFVLFFFILYSSLAFARSGGELWIYSSRKEHLVKDIFEQYEKERGIKIKYRTGEAGALIGALKAEGEYSKADILLTVDAGNLGFASLQGLLQSIESKKLAKKIPTHLRDRESRWFGLSMRARTLVYNTRKVKASELSSYEDLASPKWKGRLCLRTGKKVYNQSLVAMLIHELGREKAKRAVAGWVANAVDIYSNDTAALKAAAMGKCDVAIVNSYYYGRLMKKDSSLPLKIFWPNQKDYGVHVNISGAGVVKYSKNRGEAIRFLEWLTSERAQRQFAQVNMEYPVLKNFNPPKEVASWGSFKSNSTFHLTWAGTLQKEAVKLMHEVNYR